MTERKSTEIKIRVTPSFKARVQGAADAAGVSLTEWLEDASEERMVAFLAPLAPHSGYEFASTGKTTITSNEFFAKVIEGHAAKSWMYEGKGG